MADRLPGREGLGHGRRDQPDRGRRDRRRSFSVAVIPHTLAVTTLGRKVAGDPVNVEVDVIAKYADRLLQAGLDSPYTALRRRPGED